MRLRPFRLHPALRFTGLPKAGFPNPPATWGSSLPVIGTAVLLALSAAGLMGTGSSRAADYPQWRGPKRDGIAADTGLLKEWPKEGPKLAWQNRDVGFGYGSPAIARGRVYLISSGGLDAETVQALDEKTGRRIWSAKIGKVGNPDQRPNFPGARSTPTVENGRVYVLGSDGDLLCLEASGGKEIWRKSLRTDFEGQPGTWAYSESPLIDGNLLICTPGGSSATLVALDKKTGAVAWKCAVPGGDPAAYSSAIVGEAGGVRQVIQFLQDGVVGIDAKTGRFLWRHAATASRTNIPTPVFHNGFVYSAAGQSGGGLARIKGGPETFEAEAVYTSKQLANSIGGVVLVNGHLYGTGGASQLCVVFETGEIKWQDRSIGMGSTAYADGRLYLHGENGEVALVEATPEGYHEKGRFTPPDPPQRGQSKAWAYPVIANGRLYIRDLGILYCYDVKGS